MSKEAEKKKVKVKQPTPLKRDLQSEKRRLRNKAFKSSVKTAVRHFEETLLKGDKVATQENLNTIYSMMDKGVKRGVFKLNKASRTKMRLTARAGTLSSAS